MRPLTHFRPILDRPMAPLFAIVALVAAGCSQVGGPNLTFWDVIFSMVALYFWFMLIFIFISLFADIFRRDDLTGVVKAGWMLLIIVLPFLGALIYVAMRPMETASGEPGRSITQSDLDVQERKRQAADDLMRPPG